MFQILGMVVSKYFLWIFENSFLQKLIKKFQSVWKIWKICTLNFYKVEILYELECTRGYSPFAFFIKGIKYLSIKNIEKNFFCDGNLWGMKLYISVATS